MFRIQFISGVIITIVIYSFLSGFLKSIELRNGITLNDSVLASFPAIDLNWQIFAILFGMALLLIVRAIQNPKIFIHFLWCLIFINLVRIVTISLVPLDPPIGMIILKDPMTNTFSGESPFTKDLFFSGHTGTILLMAICLTNRIEKIFGYIAATVIGVFVLLQHVHYTIDVVAVPFFVFPIYWLVKYILKVDFLKRN